MLRTYRICSINRYIISINVEYIQNIIEIWRGGWQLLRKTLPCRSVNIVKWTVSVT